MSTTTINIGREVLCDSCNKEWTNSPVSGGFIFSGYAYCPECAISKIGSIRKYDEEQYITDRCPKDKSFADWIRDDIRGGKDGTVTVSTF